MTARHSMTEPAAAAAIDQGCRMLRLPTIRERFAEIAAAGADTFVAGSAVFGKPDADGGYRGIIQTFRDKLATVGQ